LCVEINRNPEQQSRTATLTLRTARFSIQPPLHHKQRSKLQPVSFTNYLGTRENPPSGITPISWLLLTTLEVNGFNDVVRCVVGMVYRWLIERYHYTLKSGCGLRNYNWKLPQV
jgi:hypothetical protein